MQIRYTVEINDMPFAQFVIFQDALKYASAHMGEIVNIFDTQIGRLVASFDVFGNQTKYLQKVVDAE